MVLYHRTDISIRKFKPNAYASLSTACLEWIDPCEKTRPAEGNIQDPILYPFQSVEERSPLLQETVSTTNEHDSCLNEYEHIFENLHPEKRPESESYASLLRLSADATSLSHVHFAHYHIIQSGRFQNAFLGSLLIQTYVKCEAFEDALAWFLRMHERNVFAWTFIITEYLQIGQSIHSLMLFDRMLVESVLPDQHILTSTISACGNELDISHGVQNHTRVVSCGLHTTLVVGNALVNMYGKCGCLDKARYVFDKMAKRNVITWTAIIIAYAQHGQNKMAFFMFEQMYLQEVFPNKVTLLSIMDACSHVEEAKKVHKYVIQSGFDLDIIVATAVVSMYGKCFSPENALSTFSKIPEKTVVSWNAMITVCSENGLIKEAFELFNQMHGKGMVPDKVSYIGVVNALALEADISDSKWAHHLIVEEGYESAVDVATALIHMYGRCSSLKDVQGIFNMMEDKTSVSWNYMIRAHSCHGENVLATQIFNQMIQESVLQDKHVFSSMISAYATEAALKEGKRLHVLVWGTEFETDTVVLTALLNMYCKCGSLSHARYLFDRMKTRDIISWNAMVDGYAQYGQISDILDFFNFMQDKVVAPDSATFVSILSACATLVELTEGRHFYNGTVLRGFEADTAVATAVFNMFAKCGSIQEAREMFEKMPDRNEVSWSAMVAAYAQHGHGKEALHLFNRMLEHGFRPNEVTFVSVLSACSHAGLFDEGRRWWYSMQHDYGITPIADHFDCMVDLYSRVGRLEEAEELIKDMPVEPTAISWMTLLGACRKEVDLSRGARAAQSMINLDAKDPSPYPIFSNLYAAANIEHTPDTA